MAERGGFSPATENKPLTSIDPNFSIKNGTISAPKCNQECNHDSADANASPDRGAISARLRRAMRVVMASRSLRCCSPIRDSAFANRRSSRRWRLAYTNRCPQSKSRASRRSDRPLDSYGTSSPQHPRSATTRTQGCWSVGRGTSRNCWGSPLSTSSWKPSTAIGLPGRDLWRLSRLRSREVKYVPASGNPKQTFRFVAARRDEDSLQQSLLREKHSYIVHSHIMPHELMVLALLFILEHLRNGDVAQPCGWNRLGHMTSQPACDAVLREQAPKPLVLVHGELRVIPLLNDLQHTAQSIVD